MDIRVNQTTPVNQIEQTQAAKPADGSFKFTLISTIEETELADLQAHVDRVRAIFEKTAYQTNGVLTYYYRIDPAVVAANSHEFSRENFLDKRGRHRVYGMIRLVDEKLDEIASELIKDEKDLLLIMGNIDEIRGLLLDIFT